MTDGAENSQRALWYTRRGGEVRGPFPEALIRRYVLLGRLGEDDEVSRDKGMWEVLSTHSELVPDLVRNAHESDEARERLMAARLREDERDVTDRRADESAEAVGAERRRGSERREAEPEWMVRYRRLRARTLKEASPQRARYGVVVAIVVLVGGLFAYAVRHGSGPGPRAGAKCAAAPAPAVDWSYCSLEGVRLPRADLRRADLRSTDLRGAELSGARLAGADLSYASLGTADLRGADLAHARLVGTGLGGADLRGADLARADLAYANLRGARLTGARLKGAKLDQAIWVNGRVCAEGSVGVCR